MKLSSKQIICILACLGLLLRFFLAYFFYGNFDQSSYETVAMIMKNGGNVYAETIYYNYSPLWAYILLGLYHLSNLTHFPFHFVVRGFLTIIDFWNCVLLFYITNKSIAPFLLYWLNPAVILTIGFHGQFETFSLLPLLGIILIYQRNPNKNLAVLWLLGTLSLLIKHNTLFIVWMLYYLLVNKKSWSLILSLLSSIVFLITFFPFVPEGVQGILSNVFLYHGVPRIYGFYFIPSPYGTFLLFAIMLLTPLVANKLKLTLLDSFVFSYLLFLIFMPGFSLQYFQPLFLFAGTVPSVILAVLSAVFTALFVGNYDGLHVGIGMLPYDSLWVILIAWLFIFLYSHIKPIFQKGQFLTPPIN